jgi:hypothetical protein
MRPSMASNRISHIAGLTSKAPNPAATLKLLEKKKEFDAVSALEKATELFLDRIENFGENCDIMANAAEGELYEHFTSHFEAEFVWTSSSWPSPGAMAKDVRDFELVS